MEQLWKMGAGSAVVTPRSARRYRKIDTGEWCLVRQDSALVRQDSGRRVRQVRQALT